MLICLYLTPTYLYQPFTNNIISTTGMKFSLKLGSTPALKDEFDAKFHDRILPGCENFKPLSDEYLECYARTLTGTTYHPSGTCKMGPISDKTSVVDYMLK